MITLMKRELRDILKLEYIPGKSGLEPYCLSLNSTSKHT